MDFDWLFENERGFFWIFMFIWRMWEQIGFNFVVISKK
jgi:hypothetical protein